MSTPENQPPQGPPPTEEREFTPPEVVGNAPTDANALRGHHFKRLIGMQRTWWLIGVPAVVIGGFLVTTSVVVGLIVALAIVAGGVGVVFAIADSKAADDFFNVYAENHHLELAASRDSLRRRRCCARATTSTPSER